jgi:tRNA(adenine34) deaminase
VTDAMDDVQFMEIALAHAADGAAGGEVPVGAIVVKDGTVIATGRNKPVGDHDPTAHAEIVALRSAAKVLGNYRLDGCHLYVTLEPCAMCSGAILHARLSRLVFGAADPKTGAAGSVVNLFANAQLNHHTEVLGGVLAEQCANELQSFFRERRSEHGHARKSLHRLRDDSLRTPDARFQQLDGYPWSPRYVNDLPSLDGLRMHFIDEGPQNADLCWLCVHGNSSWSYAYRRMIPAFLEAGHRVIAPDLIGFGKSDKPKKASVHSLGFHRHVLRELLEELSAQRVVLVLQDWGILIGLAMAGMLPQRVVGVLVMDTSHETCEAAYQAPFVDNGYRAAIRAFSEMGAPGLVAQDSPECAQPRLTPQSPWHGPVLHAMSLQQTTSSSFYSRELARFLGNSLRVQKRISDGDDAELAGEAIAFFCQDRPVLPVVR